MELRRIQKGVAKVVPLHHCEVKARKEESLVSKQSLRLCQERASKAIPEILEEIEKSPHPVKTRDPQWAAIHRLYGYLEAYITSIYGKRTGVFANMRVKEVRNAIGDDQMGYLINVAENKTMASHGYAQIYLLKEEMGWFQKWLALRSRSVPKSTYFFVTAWAGPPKNLVTYLRNAWREMGLPKSRSFYDIRTAVCTYNYRDTDPSLREDAANFMNHGIESHKRLPCIKTLAEHSE
ncbi:uncharacterized protein LOC125905863 [Epinephelus fuscoguttatus]|uniref:uncharacterized protein LOC125905863 n=1 Tax=Epinephelus fuscoguttatus TaxID=293821 RepID=UPI0020D16CB8|nr:uncharacterized protein LOC125905863 [Epinephelus fuscoguttatus]